MADHEKKKGEKKGFLNKVGVLRQSPIKLTFGGSGSSKSTSGKKQEAAAPASSASGHHHDNGPLREAARQYMALQPQWLALKEQFTKMETEAACAEKHRVEIKKIREAHDADEKELREKLKFVYEAREEAQLKLRTAESELAKARTRSEGARHDQTRSKEQDEEVAKLHATLEEIQSSQDKAISDLQKLQTTLIANLATSRAARQAQDAERKEEQKEALSSINKLQEHIASVHQLHTARLIEAARSEEQLRASLHEAEQNAAVQGRLAGEIALRHDHNIDLIDKYFRSIPGWVERGGESAMESVKRHGQDPEEYRNKEIAIMETRIATLLDLRKTLLGYIAAIQKVFEEVKDKVGVKEALMISHIFEKVEMLGSKSVPESFADVQELAKALDKADVLTRSYMSSGCKLCPVVEAQRDDARQQRKLILQDNTNLMQEIEKLKQKIEHLSGTTGGSRPGSRDRSSVRQTHDPAADVVTGGVTSHHGSEPAHHLALMPHGSAEPGVPISSVQQPHDLFAGFPNIDELMGRHGHEGEQHQTQFAPARSDSAGSEVPISFAQQPGNLFAGHRWSEHRQAWIKTGPEPARRMALTTTRPSGSGKARVPIDKGKRAVRAPEPEPAGPGGNRSSSKARTVHTVHRD